jgi:kinesin family protein C1
MDSLAREKEARLNMERSQTSLSEELARAQRDLLSANQKVKLII